MLHNKESGKINLVFDNTDSEKALAKMMANVGFTKSEGDGIRAHGKLVTLLGAQFDELDPLILQFTRQLGKRIELSVKINEALDKCNQLQGKERDALIDVIRADHQLLIAERKKEDAIQDQLVQKAGEVENTLEKRQQETAKLVGKPDLHASYAKRDINSFALYDQSMDAFEANRPSKVNADEFYNLCEQGIPQLLKTDESPISSRANTPPNDSELSRSSLSGRASADDAMARTASSSSDSSPDRSPKPSKGALKFVPNEEEKEIPVVHLGSAAKSCAPQSLAAAPKKGGLLSKLFGKKPTPPALPAKPEVNGQAHKALGI